MVQSAGLEPATSWTATRRSNPTELRLQYSNRILIKVKCQDLYIFAPNHFSDILIQSE